MVAFGFIYSYPAVWTCSIEYSQDLVVKDSDPSDSSPTTDQEAFLLSSSAFRLILNSGGGHLDPEVEEQINATGAALENADVRWCELLQILREERTSIMDEILM